VSDALTVEQKQILEQRGVLTPEEIHRLAHKTRKGVAADGEKAPCHSDLSSTEHARQIQSVKVDPASSDGAERLDPLTLEPLERSGDVPHSA
jgi:phosphomethylpyrimidine synthase